MKLAYRQFWQLPHNPAAAAAAGAMTFPHALYNFPGNPAQQATIATPGGGLPFASLLPQTTGGLMPFGLFAPPNKTIQSEPTGTSLSLQQLAQLVGSSNPTTLSSLITSGANNFGLNNAQIGPLMTPLGLSRLLASSSSQFSSVNDQLVAQFGVKNDINSKNENLIVNDLERELREEVNEFYDDLEDNEEDIQLMGNEEKNLNDDD